MVADEPTRRSVRATYDRIGEHFAETRAHPWPAVQDFLADPGPVDLALDAGCGNGRHAELLESVADRVVCLDASPTMLATAGERVDSTRVAGDVARLPMRSGTIDLAVSIATVHHLPDRSGRITAIEELARVLAPGGRALVSVWSTAHDRFAASADDRTGFDTTVAWTLPDGEVVDRFYHIHSPAEFDRDLARADARVIDRFDEQGNCWAVIG
ncbi:MAG: class I SAM-dependent methyltransferase [Halococcoides sp.]